MSYERDLKLQIIFVEESIFDKVLGRLLILNLCRIKKIIQYFTKKNRLSIFSNCKQLL